MHREAFETLMPVAAATCWYCKAQRKQICSNYSEVLK